MPVDAAPMVSSGKLDSRLFNVTKLISNGYGDAERADIPLIMTTPRGLAKTVRDLPSIGAGAVSVPKTTSFWADARTLSDSPGRIWLDGPVRATLDKSVSQIGAPEAWNAGHTGKDALVAVLDTGVDVTHPDLLGTVVDAKNFSDSPAGTDDRVGHGTHVASTITGDNTRYKGVAPDAKLLNGKVLDDTGNGSDSQVIAGMEWAAGHGAKVINMSLGNEWPSDGTDLLSHAVNQLTEQTGALFVVAAGNAPDILGSPAAADAALTVGAVDSHDRLADFSARGPRVGDESIKPDITAPGVDITAARAKNSLAPGDSHLMLSGTSMAAPHVAGAAAILAQQHPDWSAGQLKAALMGTAKANPALSAFEQGAGRVDVARATSQAVYAMPASISNGVAQWPHEDDQPITRTLTYYNSSATTRTLQLGTEIRDPSGNPAPAGMFTVQPRELTIAPGTKAQVTVVANTAVNGPDGIYSGVIAATGQDTTVRTPIALNREVESYNIKLNAIDHDGNPTSDYEYAFVGESNLRWSGQLSDPSLIRLPKGRFSLGGYVSTAGDIPRTTAFAEPDFAVTGDGSFTFDAREGKPVTITVDRPSARTASLDLKFLATQPWGLIDTAPWVGRENTFIRPSTTAAPGRFEFVAEATLAEPDGSGGFSTSSYQYNVRTSQDGRVPAGVVRTFRTGELAKVRTQFATTAPDQEAQWGAIRRELPFALDEYYSPDQPWHGTLLLWDKPGQFWPDSAIGSWPRTFKLGPVTTERWNQAVFGPAFPQFPDFPATTAGRQGDELRFAIPLRTDQSLDHIGQHRATTGTTVLYRDGKQIGDTVSPGYGRFDVPSGPARYRLHTTATGPFELSTKFSADWAFHSDTGTGPLPLMAVRFAPALDGHNQAPAVVPTIVPVQVQHNLSSPVRPPAIQVSHDDGASWRPAPLITAGGRWFTVLTHPKGAKSVSLKATASDVAGNTVEQTIIRAFTLKG